MSIRANLSGKPLLCAAAAARDLAQRGYPVPQEFGRANSFLCPRGRQPGRGWLLMRRKDAEAFDKAARHTLTFHDGARTVELQGLVYVTSRCLTVGSVNRDPAGAHLVEVADERWLAANPLYQHGLNQQYNVVAPDYRAATDADRWLSDTLDGTDPWTWRTLLTDLWSRLPAAAVAAPCPDLALVPDDGEPYVPHNWRFVGQPVWEAIHDILEHLSLALALDPLQAPDAAGRFRVVDPGTADAALDELHAEAATAKALIYDRAAVDNPAARLPATVRVHFPAPPRHHGGGRDTGNDGDQWQGAPAYTKDISNPYGNGQADALHPVWSDFEVHTLADGSHPSGTDYGGTGAADTWASTLATGYFRTLHAGGTPLMQRIYLGAWSFTPGSMVSGVAWRQGDWTRQGAVLTEIVRGSGQAVRVGDEGRFEGLGANRPAQAPALGWGFPVYPPHVQIIGAGSGSGTGGLDGGTLYQYDADVGDYIAQESVWKKPLSGKDLGRLAGYEQGRPVYLIPPTPGGLSEVQVSPTPPLHVSTTGGVATVSLDVAAVNAPGYVTDSTQTFGGIKTFQATMVIAKAAGTSGGAGGAFVSTDTQTPPTTSSCEMYFDSSNTYFPRDALILVSNYGPAVAGLYRGDVAIPGSQTGVFCVGGTYGACFAVADDIAGTPDIHYGINGAFIAKSPDGQNVEVEVRGGIVIRIGLTGSGSGSGSVATGDTLCCPDTDIPATLILTLPDTTPIYLTQGEAMDWNGSHGGVSYQMICEWDSSIGGVVWALYMGDFARLSADPGGACDPFAQTFTDGGDVYEVTE